MVGSMNQEGFLALQSGEDVNNTSTDSHTYPKSRARGLARI